MGKRGPKRTPTKVLAARGSWLAKVRKGEPEADGLPVAPDWLQGPALAAWNALLPMLMNMGIIGRVDTNAIARYCELLARYRECQDFIARYGQTLATKTETGIEVREYPQVGRASKLADQLLRLEQNFGMTPSARSSLAIDVKAKQARNADGIESYISPKLVG